MTDVVIETGGYRKSFNFRKELPHSTADGSIIEGVELSESINVNSTQYEVFIRHYVRRGAPEGGYTCEHSASVTIRDKNFSNGFISESTILPGQYRRATLDAVSFKISHKK